MQMRSNLAKIPILKDYGSRSLLEQISIFMEQKIYLPNDYIILKDDVGEEIFFIVEGAVDIMAGNERSVVWKLDTGAFFGEIALLNASKRMCSVVANTLSAVYVLKKDNFDSLLRGFPSIERKLREESRKRERDFDEKQAALHKKMIADSDNESQVERKTLDYSSDQGNAKTLTKKDDNQSSNILKNVDNTGKSSEVDIRKEKSVSKISSVQTFEPDFEEEKVDELKLNSPNKTAPTQPDKDSSRTTTVTATTKGFLDARFSIIDKRRVTRMSFPC